jgi:hypothetical protein
MPNDQLELAEQLRNYLLTYPDLPVKKGELLLDGLNEEGDSICLQLNPGAVIKTYLDGGRIMRQPFTLFYRSTTTDNNLNKAQMIQFLNDVGSWMDKNNPPNLSPSYKTIKIEQATLATIYIRDQVEIGYQASYLLDYEKL